MSKEATLRLDWRYAEDFKRAYVTNSFGIAGEYDYRLTFGVSDVILAAEPQGTPKVSAEYRVEVVLPFRAVKELRNLVDEAVKRIETRFGEIKLPKKPEDYFKQP